MTEIERLLRRVLNDSLEEVVLFGKPWVRCKFCRNCVTVSETTGVGGIVVHENSCTHSAVNDYLKKLEKRHEVQ